MTNIQDIERKILGGILEWPKMLTDICQILTPDDFELTAHQKIYRVMLKFSERQQPLDLSIMLLESELAGLAAFASDLSTGIMEKSPWGQYCRIVKDAANARRVKKLLATAVEKEHSPDTVTQLVAALSEFQTSSNLGRGAGMFISSDRFMSTVPEEIDWLVDGLIERGANGIIAGAPKVSKSWIAALLGLCLSLGIDFLGHRVRRPVRVALISREDHPGLTGWRLRALRKGLGYDSSPNLVLNTRAQTASLMLDNPGDVRAIIEELKHHRAEFAIFDVFNVLHGKDENDNQEMRQVLQQLSRIQTDSKCAIGLVHHFNKLDSGSWTQRLRGSSAIAGWVEWLMGVTFADEATKTRKVEFELKAGNPPDAVYYNIESDEVDKTARIRTGNAPQITNPKRNAARLIT
jgi:hypothetical protein